MDVNELNLKDFARHLRARNKSPKTIASYLDSARRLAAFHDGKPLTDLGPDAIEAFIADQLERHKPATAAVRFRSLQQFYKWAASEPVGIIPASPMHGLTGPVVVDNPPDVLSDEQITALLKACQGREFTELRDTAIIRLMLIAGGPRLGEMAAMQLDDVDLDHDLVHVIGKGRRTRAMPFSDRTATAVTRYLRARERHPSHRSAFLWLGARGRLTESGITQALRRRAAQAGIPHLHPHMLRHTSAHRWKAAGGSDGDTMRLFGWRSMEMVNRYGAKLADERAIDAARKLAIDDDV